MYLGKMEISLKDRKDLNILTLEDIVLEILHDKEKMQYIMEEVKNNEELPIILYIIISYALETCKMSRNRYKYWESIIPRDIHDIMKKYNLYV